MPCPEYLHGDGSQCHVCPVGFGVKSGLCVQESDTGTNMIAIVSALSIICLGTGAGLIMGRERMKSMLRRVFSAMKRFGKGQKVETEDSLRGDVKGQDQGATERSEAENGEEGVRETGDGNNKDVDLREDNLYDCL